MATEEIHQYYNATENSAVRSSLAYAVSLMGDTRIAVDCGCGAGADIAYLRDNDFTVHAFDSEAESIARCSKRFHGDVRVLLSHASFSNFTYPRASLVVADASLFFCPKSDFDGVWHNISASLISGGIFCGSFLGPNDTMASPDYDGDAFWPIVTAFAEAEVRARFEGFRILKWEEHNVSGKTAQDVPHRWHIFSVVAEKLVE